MARQRTYRQDVADPGAADDVTGPPRPPGLRLLAALVAAALGFYLVAVLDRSATEVQESQQADVTERSLDEVAPALASLCASDATVKARAGDAVCATAAAATVARDGRNGDDGRDGDDGEPGRGITGTTIVDGHLIIAYTDGTTLDVGQVVGPPGAAGTDGDAGDDGTDGEEGRGITGTSIVDGRLVLAFSDGDTLDVGPVVGPGGAAGRGIDSTTIVDGRLIISYDDGTSDDAGPVPVGSPPPPAGELIVNRVDGTTDRCVRTGGPDTAPVYTCTPAPAPPAPPAPAPDPAPEEEVTPP